jgi:septal ring factor EnvC (AmiA/AmiB activator)
MLLWFQKNMIIAIVLAAMGAVIAGESALALHQSKKLGEAGRNQKFVERERDQSQQDLASLQLAFDAQKTAHEKCLDEVKVSVAENKSAVEQIAAFDAQLKATSGAIRSIRDKIYLEASCNALATIDINAVCPALAGSLRQRAAMQAKPSP